MMRTINQKYKKIMANKVSYDKLIEILGKKFSKKGTQIAVISNVRLYMRERYGNSPKVDAMADDISESICLKYSIKK
jgi:hypothetical protein